MKIKRLKKEDRFSLCCVHCGEEIEYGKNYFLIENRNGDFFAYCPACAAVYLAETLEEVSRECEWEDDVLGA